MAPRTRVTTTMLALALTLVIAVPAAETGERKTRVLSATLRASAIATEGNRILLTGHLNGRPFGEGVILLRLRLGAGGRATGTFQDYYPEGGPGGRIRLLIAPQQDGSVKLTGTGRFTGGFGKYRRARGSFTLNGRQPAGSPVSVDKLRGTITY